MTNPLNNIKQAAGQIRLSHDEKAVMRAKIFAAIDTAHTPAPRRTHTSYWFFSMRYVAAFSLILVVLVGSGTTYAAQGSLPGGLLYPVKIYVNEQVEGALAVSSESKLAFHTSVAQERLKEAETLASQGKLTATATAQIEANLAQHTSEADKIADAIEQEDPSAGVEARITLDSSLAAHRSILARLGDDSTDDTTKTNSNTLAMRVSQYGYRPVVATAAARTMEAPVSDAPAAKMAPMALSIAHTSSAEDTDASTTADAYTDASSTAQQKIVIKLQQKAASELDDARSAYAKAEKFLDASTTAAIEDQLTALEDARDQGDKAVEDGLYDQARALFASVLSQSVELNARIEASTTFKKDFIRSGWSKGSDNAEDDTDSTDTTDNGWGNGPLHLHSGGWH
jgi:hypothetical protein